MKTITMIILTVFISTLDLSSQNIPIVDSFGKQIYNTLKTNNIQNIIKLIPTNADIELISKNARLKYPSNKKNPNLEVLKTNLKQHQKDINSNILNDFNSAFEIPLEIGKVFYNQEFDWNNSKYYNTDFKIFQENGITFANMTIYIIFNSNGYEYPFIIYLKDCLFAGKKVLIGKSMSISEDESYKEDF